MKNFRLNILWLVLIACFSLNMSSADELEAEAEEKAQPSTPQQLLEVVKQGQFADTQAQRDRESKFRNEKNKHS